jgi:hypothetical protein
MSTPELDQAIASSKWKGAERDVQEIIAKLLDADPAIVARVVYAWELLKEKRLIHDDGQLADMFAGLGCGDPINDPEVRHAIEHGVARGFRRAAIRWRMEQGSMLEVEFKKLVPATAKSRMCDGCIWQLECVRDMLSTPEQCWNGKYVFCVEQFDGKASRRFQHQYAIARPVKLEGALVTVECDHPRGTFVISVMDVRI